MSKNEERMAAFIPAMISLLLGGLCSLLAAIILLLLCAAAVSRGLLAQSRETQLVVAAVLVSAFVGGLVAKKGWTQKRLFAGLLSGLIFYLMLALVGVLGYSGINIMENGIGALVGCICGGAVSGLSGSRQGRRGKRSNRRTHGRSAEKKAT